MYTAAAAVAELHKMVRNHSFSLLPFSFVPDRKEAARKPRTRASPSAIAWDGGGANAERVLDTSPNFNVRITFEILKASPLPVADTDMGTDMGTGTGTSTNTITDMGTGTGTGMGRQKRQRCGALAAVHCVCVWEPLFYFCAHASCFPGNRFFFSLPPRQDSDPAVRIVKQAIELQGKRETTHFLFDRCVQKQKRATLFLPRERALKNPITSIVRKQIKFRAQARHYEQGLHSVTTKTIVSFHTC